MEPSGDRKDGRKAEERKGKFASCRQRGGLRSLVPDLVFWLSISETCWSGQFLSPAFATGQEDGRKVAANEASRCLADSAEV